MNKIELALEEYTYAMNEEINTLRTNIQFAGADKQVILVTSCVPGEGKSSVSMRIARSLAELKKKVLLIDADLRKSVVIEKVIGEKPKKGLSHLLSGQAVLSDVVYATNIRGFHMIIAGSVPPNPTEVLSGEVFSKMLTAVRSVYDYIIIDSAPLGLVVDAAILAKQCDGSILLLESENIKYRFAQDVKRKLEATGCPIIGAVLTKMKKKSSGKYYGKYYGKYERYDHPHKNDAGN